MNEKILCGVVVVMLVLVSGCVTSDPDVMMVRGTLTSVSYDAVDDVCIVFVNATQYRFRTNEGYPDEPTAMDVYNASLPLSGEDVVLSYHYAGVEGMRLVFDGIKEKIIWTAVG